MHAYFERRKDDVGTHSDVCWKHHPDCAYWVGRAAVGPDSERIRELEAENKEEPVNRRTFDQRLARFQQHLSDVFAWEPIWRLRRWLWRR